MEELTNGLRLLRRKRIGGGRERALVSELNYFFRSATTFGGNFEREHEQGYSCGQVSIEFGRRFIEIPHMLVMGRM